MLSRRGVVARIKMVRSRVRKKEKKLERWTKILIRREMKIKLMKEYLRMKKIRINPIKAAPVSKVLTVFWTRQISLARSV